MFFFKSWEKSFCGVARYQIAYGPLPVSGGWVPLVYRVRRLLYVELEIATARRSHITDVEAVS